MGALSGQRRRALDFKAQRADSFMCGSSASVGRGWVDGFIIYLDLENNFGEIVIHKVIVLAPFKHVLMSVDVC